VIYTIFRMSVAMAVHTSRLVRKIPSTLQRIGMLRSSGGSSVIIPPAYATARMLPEFVNL
jgi:hypothetical protein